MTKRLVAKTGEYTNQQQETKGEYTKIGVELSNDKGSYLLLDPSVSLAGVLLKQNALAAKQGKPSRDSVMVSIFADENQQQAQPQQQYQQPVPQQAPPQQYAPAPQQSPAYNQAPQQAPTPQGYGRK